MKAMGLLPPIDDDRYHALCEVGTHPVPAFKPGHYSGGGPPVLGLLFQFVGYAMCLNELGYAIERAGGAGRCGPSRRRLTR
jgi:hypothetical protein